MKFINPKVVERIILGIIVLLGVISYVHGLGYGLHVAPSEWHMSWDDEVNRINIRMFFNRTLNPHWFFHPTFFYYLTAIFYLPYLFVFHLIHNVPINGIMNSYPELTYHLIMVSRSVTVVIAVLLILMTYKFAKEIFGRNAGILAAALMVANGGLNAYAHVAHPLVCSVLFITASLWASARFQSSGLRNHFYLSCVLAGLAVSTYYNTLILLPALSLSLFLVYKNHGGQNSNKNFPLIKTFLFGMLTLVGFFLLATPYLVFDFQTFKFHFFYQYLNKGNIPLTSEHVNTYSIMPRYFIKSLGLPMALACLAGTIFQLTAWCRNRKPALTILFTVLVPYLLFIGSWQRLEPRWLVTVSTILVTLLTGSIVQIMESLKEKQQWLRWSVAATVSVLLIFSYARNIAAGDFLLNDPRYEVTRYMASSVKKGNIEVIGNIYSNFVQIPAGFSPTYTMFEPEMIPGIADRIESSKVSDTAVLVGSEEELIIENISGKKILEVTKDNTTSTLSELPDEFFIVEINLDSGKEVYRIHIKNSSMIKEARLYTGWPALDGYVCYPRPTSLLLVRNTNP